MGNAGGNLAVKDFIIVALADTIVIVDVGPIVVIFYNDVYHPSHSVVAVHGASSVLKDFNPVNSSQRNRVQVDERKCPSQRNWKIRKSMAIDQSQRTID